MCIGNLVHLKGMYRLHPDKQLQNRHAGIMGIEVRPFRIEICYGLTIFLYHLFKTSVFQFNFRYHDCSLLSSGFTFLFCSCLVW